MSIDYSEKSKKLTTFFRIFTFIPIFIILFLMFGIFYADFKQGVGGYYASAGTILGGAGFVIVPTALMILFRKMYPRWWFNWNLSLTKFTIRVFSYLLLLRDEYPSTDEEQAVHIEITYPDAEKYLRRGMPLIKWILAIPHAIILCFLYIVPY